MPIRLIAAEKASGGLKLLVQLPYRLTDLVAPKFAALLAAWLIALIPVLSALVCWGLIGGHLDARDAYLTPSSAQRACRHPIRHPRLRPCAARKLPHAGITVGQWE